MAVVVLDEWRIEGSPGPEPTPDGLTEALTTARDDELLVIAGGTRPIRSAHVARAVVRRDGVAVVEISGPPTRRHLLAYALDQLAPSAYGYAGAVLEAMEQVLVTRALLSSVANLSEPQPRLVHHVAGWFPGQWFQAELDTGVVRRTRETRLELPPAPLGSLAARWTDLDRLALEPVPATGIVLTGPAGAGWWRCREWAEATVATEDVRAVVQRTLDGATAVECPSCDRPVTGTVCVFCGVRLPVLHAHQGASPRHTPERSRT